jgi:hypothetical protein
MTGGTQRTYDTLWADWSGYSGAVTWINDPAGAALNIGPATVKNIERMLITTGASNDEIDNSKVGNTDDYIATGAGDDIIRLGGGQGVDLIDGGANDDTLHIDASALGGYQLQLAGYDASGTLKLQADDNSTYQQVRDVLAMPTQRITYGWLGLTQYIQINGIENVSTMIGTNVSGAYNGDDLLWVKGKAGGMYDGGDTAHLRHAVG